MKKKVQVWIYRGDKALLLKTTQKRGGFWQPVTGSVEKNETLTDAALREAAEETGFLFSEKPQSIHYQFEFDDQKWGNGKCLEVCYSLLAPSESPPQLDPQEHESFEWVDFKHVEARLHFDSNQKAFKFFLETI